ncbi:SMI1/KNR4 family protein, partial [Brevibacillus fortis]|nr:SMI1/KNR4 family protein [Brevibacillus fortis]
MSNPFEALISKIRGSRTSVDRNVHIKNEEYHSTFYISNESITDTKEKLKSFELPEDYVIFLSHYESAKLFKDAKHNSG